MSKSRRQFLTHTPHALLGAAAASYGQAQKPSEPPPGAPPAFGTAPPVGPEVSPATFAQAEQLVEVELSAEELALAAGNWRSVMAPMYERRVGPRKVGLEETSAPATLWNPVLPSQNAGPASNQFVRSNTDPGPLPGNDDDIAFATVTQLSDWIEQRFDSWILLTHPIRLVLFDGQAVLQEGFSNYIFTSRSSIAVIFITRGLNG